MPSDLATALISGNNAGLMADPAMATIAPQLQLAQALSTQGLSTAPAAPAQALGRLAQALAGVKVRSDAEDQLGALSSGSTAEMGKIFPEGTPIGDGLRSNSGLVRMLSMQQAGKAMLLNSESKKVGPTDTIVAPGTPRYGGSVVAAGSPGMAGMAEAAKNQPLINRAAGEAAAKAPYEAGGEITVDTPRGREAIPATAATRAAIQPDATGKDQSRLPSGLPGPGGQPVKTPEFEGDVKGREELYGAANKAIGGVVAEHIEAGGKSARDKLNALDSIESSVRAFGPNVVTGPHAEFALRAKEALNGIGLNADWINKGLPETEVVQKMNAQLASASAKAMTGRPTQFEFASWQKNNPGLLTSKQGTLALTDILRQQAQNDIDLGKLAQNKKNWDNWPEVVDKFYETHGLTNPLTGKPMRDEIAASKAGTAIGAPAARGGETAAKMPQGAPEGTKLAPDGRWYAPDPSRPGKFLRVEGGK